MIRIRSALALFSALFVLTTATGVHAMTKQEAPLNADGSSKLVDPDAAVERMVDRMRDGIDAQGLPSFSDSSVVAREAVRVQGPQPMPIRPFR